MLPFSGAGVSFWAREPWLSDGCRFVTIVFGRIEHGHSKPARLGLGPGTARGNEIGSAKPEEYWHEGAVADAPNAVSRIGVGDLWDALARGVADFEANRTDVIFLCVIYPMIGMVLGRLASGHGCCHSCSRSHRASR